MKDPTLFDEDPVLADHVASGHREEGMKMQSASFDFLKLIDEHAIDRHDGHLMLVRCTTGWQFRYGWPMMYANLGQDSQVSYFDPEHLPVFTTLEEALAWASEHPDEAAWTPRTAKAEDV